MACHTVSLWMEHVPCFWNSRVVKYRHKVLPREAILLRFGTFQSRTLATVTRFCCERSMFAGFWPVKATISSLLCQSYDRNVANWLLNESGWIQTKKSGKNAISNKKNAHCATAGDTEQNSASIYRARRAIVTCDRFRWHLQGKLKIVTCFARQKKFYSLFFVAHRSTLRFRVFPCKCQPKKHQS